MKKLLINLALVFLFFFIILLITLSTIGIKTNKFNEFIKEKTSEKGKINLELKSIKFKIDPKKLSLFLETENPNINYSDVTVPVQNLKVYVDVLSFIKTRPKIKKINLVIKYDMFYLIIFNILPILLAMRIIALIKIINKYC